MKVFVTGTDGYIGCMLGQMLLERGHDVTGCDTGCHRVGLLYNGQKMAPKSMVKDIRNVTEQDLKGFDAVIHLAELSNDPVGELDPTITFKINHIGSVELAKNAKKAGVPRFVYFSSCSVYGASATSASDEKSGTDPLTSYAKCKLLVERDLAPMADDNFTPTFLRNATAYGASPRQRFDLVVNNLAGLAWTTKQIKMDSDGTPWRPLVHLLDICQAACCTVEADRKIVHNQVFNVGDNKENYQVKDVARIVSDTFPGCTLSMGTRGGDKRDYRVNFDKINSTLPGFKCKHTVPSGAKQLLRVFEKIGMTPELFQSRGHTRLKQIQHLISTKQIDADFFWTT
ncbi:SDR family oxidoreductase [soil metagenome]